MQSDFVTTSTNEPNDSDAGADLAVQLAGVNASAIVLFAAHQRDAKSLIRSLQERHPAAEIVGCTTAGEFTERSYGVGGAVAIAIPRRKAPRAAAALASFEGSVLEGVRLAAREVSAKLGRELRDCDPSRYVGLVLLEGLRGHEEAANDALGQVAPFLSFVGGSAGDDFQLRETRVHSGDATSRNGGVLLVLEMQSRFALMKTSSFRPRTKALRVTRADPARRLVYELDGRPIVDVYCAALEIPSERLDRRVFASHPLGLMIEGAPWVRSPKTVRPDGAIHFACQLLEGMQVHVMDPTDLIEDTRRAFVEGERALGGPIAGAVLFNCVHRRWELEDRNLVSSFRSLLRFPSAGFHTYGESWLGHINHTLTGLLFA